MFSKAILLVVATASMVSAQSAAYGQCEFSDLSLKRRNTNIFKAVVKASADLRLVYLVGHVHIQMRGTPNVFPEKVSLSLLTFYTQP